MGPRRRDRRAQRGPARGRAPGRRRPPPDRHDRRRRRPARQAARQLPGHRPRAGAGRRRRRGRERPRSIEGGAAAVRALTSRRPEITGIFTYNDVLAVGAVRGLKAAGLRVPEDCAVVGFDGLPLGELVEPPITSVYVDIRRMGELAVAAAAELLAGRAPEPVLMRPELRVRGSA
ncbi:substrate-binding domain-containing protein [Catenulispora yoronensis]